MYTLQNETLLQSIGVLQKDCRNCVACRTMKFEERLQTASLTLARYSELVIDLAVHECKLYVTN